MQSGVAQLWSAALARPFFESDGVSVRPVVCGEALFKSAMAVCFASCNKAVDRAVGPGQIGARKHDGAGTCLRK